jgi:hypothetical protein
MNKNINILPLHILNSIKDYLWGTNIYWKNQFHNILNKSTPFELKHIYSFPDCYINIIQNKEISIFKRNMSVIQILQSLNCQRRLGIEYEIEDELYCNKCGEKNVFPFTRTLCYDCEK